MDEALRPAGPCRARERENLLHIGCAPRALGASGVERAAEAAKRGMAGEPFQLRVEPLEWDDAVREARMLAAERPARDGVHPSEIRRIE